MWRKEDWNGAEEIKKKKAKEKKFEVEAVASMDGIVRRMGGGRKKEKEERILKK